MQIFNQQVDKPLETSEFTNTVLPAGRYAFMIVDGRVAPDTSWAMIKLQVLEGNFEGKSITHFFAIGGSKSQEQIQKSLREIRSLCEIFQIKGTINSMDVFVNKSFSANVQFQKEGMYQGRPQPARNWVSFALDEMETYQLQQAPIAALSPAPSAPTETAAPSAPPQGGVPNWG